MSPKLISNYTTCFPHMKDLCTINNVLTDNFVSYNRNVKWIPIKFFRSEQDVDGFNENKWF